MKSKAKNYKIVDHILLSICIVSMACAIALLSIHKSVSARASSVKIYGINGQCSGVQIKAKSGKEYILSAGHCSHVSNSSSVTIQTEDGRVLERQIIKEDEDSDLLLIEAAPGVPSISILHSENIGDKVETFTHGGGMATYETSGELIEYKSIDIPIALVISPEAQAACKSVRKNRLLPIEMFGEIVYACGMHLDGVVSTAHVIPGSSGGMVVKDDKLIGIVSATDGNFGFFVSLRDIHNFVDNY